MDEKEKWEPPHLAITIIKVILNALQVNKKKKKSLSIARKYTKMT
jgi:hypothetical protein